MISAITGGLGMALLLSCGSHEATSNMALQGLLGLALMYVAARIAPTKGD